VLGGEAKSKARSWIYQRLDGPCPIVTATGCQGGEGEDALEGGVANKDGLAGRGAIPDVGDEQINVSPLTAVRRQTPSRTVEIFQSTTRPDFSKNRGR